MSEDLKLPQHVLLKEEPEEEEHSEDQQTGQVAQQVSQSTSASSTLYEKQAITAQNQENNGNYNVEITPNENNNVLQGSTSSSQATMMLTIKQLSGETVQLLYTDELKAMSISNLKRAAFPLQAAQGYSIRFIYRGRLLGEGECLNNLQFIDQPIIHAQLNPPILLQDQQNSNTGEGQQQQQQQHGQISVEMQNNNNNNNNVQMASANNDNNNIQGQLQEPLNQQVLIAVNNQPTVSIQTIALEDEGTTCDFWFGLFLVLFLDLVGMIIVFCCQYSRKARKGAVIAFVIRCVLNLLFYNGDDQGDS